MTSTVTAIEDRYPTRVLGGPKLLERLDPTVWTGASTPGPIDPATLASYDSRGFLTVDGLLGPAEVRTYQQELARLARDPEIRADERTIVELDSQEIRSIFEVHRISPLIAELARDPQLRGRAEQILGSRVYVHQSRVNFMPAFEGKGFYWHSDFETWHAEDGMPAPRALSFSIALTDNYPFNGGLMLIPGSHRKFVSCVGVTPEDNYKSSLRSQVIGTPDREMITKLGAELGIEQFTGLAGSAVIFDCNTMHGSGNNITPFARSNIFLVFNSVDNALGEPFAVSAPRPEFIASRTLRNGSPSANCDVFAGVCHERGEEFDVGRAS
jgi:ectoine hydroxylase